MIIFVFDGSKLSGNLNVPPWCYCMLSVGQFSRIFDNGDMYISFDVRICPTSLHFLLLFGKLLSSHILVVWLLLLLMVSVSDI